jgi:hypothetical protein
MPTPDLLGTPEQAADAAMNPDSDSSTDFSVVPPSAQSASSQPTATTQNYPDSPDQNPANNPIAGTSDDTTAGAPQKHSLFRNIVLGALSGIERHLAGAGEGLLAGGIPGAIVGAAQPERAEAALQNQRAIQNAQTQRMQYQAANAQEQAAISHVDLLNAERIYNAAPKSLREQFDQSHAAALQSSYHAAMDSGNATAVQSFGDYHDPDAWTALRKLQGAYMEHGVDQPFNYAAGVDDSGKLVLMKVRNMDTPIREDINLPTGEKDADGNPVMFNIPSGTPWAKAQDLMIKVETAKMQNALKIHQAQATGVVAKNEATAAKSNAQATAAVNGSAGEWRPKVTSDEKKKVELAENGMVNINEIASIIQRRPDLLGPASGRITSIEQMMGSNDRDITALATAVHNLSMVNSGIHGFRSQEGVKSYEQMVLNNFKNGPQAVAGALRAAATSAQTFIDNGRPETYRTHSKNGGGLRGMLPQGGK